MSDTVEYSAVILSVNRALWGEVSLPLRSVQVEYNDSEVNIYCFFDGEISEESRESMHAVGSSIAGDFKNNMVYDHCIRVDYPAPVPRQEGRHLVFLRKE